jgi:hypothetical protein
MDIEKKSKPNNNQPLQGREAKTLPSTYSGEKHMSKFRPEALSLFYFLNREEAELTFNSLVTITETIKAAKHTEEARRKLKTLLPKTKPKDRQRAYQAIVAV